MADNFNMKKGIINALKTALKNEDFVVAVFDMLLGEKDAPGKVEHLLKAAGQENTLNEMVAVHRLYKQKININEGISGKNGLVTKDMLKKVWAIRKKSNKFMTKVLVRTLKEPGMIASLIYIIKAMATVGYPLDDLLAAPQVVRFIACLIKNAVQLAEEESGESEPQAALAESVMVERMRRMMKHASHKKSMLSEEEMGDRYGGRMPVNVYCGRFQPFHLGHLSNLEEAAKLGLRTVICPVMKGKTANALEHPFEAIDGEMFEKLKSAYGDLIADIIPIQRSFIEFWIKPLRERGYEPITWTTGADRKPLYESMVEKYKEKYGLVDDFKVIGLAKDMDAEGGSADDTGKISGGAIRKCLMNNDREGFMRQMPKCLWDMYDKMREAVMAKEQPAQAVALTEDEMRRKILDEAIERLVKGIRE